MKPINIIRTTVMKSLNIDSIEYKFMKKNWSYFLRRIEKVSECKIFKARSGLEEPVFDIFIEIGNAYSMHKGFRDISNSIAECSNNQIKTIIKVAYGYQNFERFRKRVLLLLWNQVESEKQ